MRTRQGRTMQQQRDSQGRFTTGRGSRGYYNERDYDTSERRRYTGNYDTRSEYGDYDREDESRGGYQYRNEDRDYESRENDQTYGGERRGGRGFASMDRDEVREIASRGGRSRGGSYNEYNERENDRDYEDRSHTGYAYDEDYDNRRSGRYGQGRGFASMDRNEVREIAGRGGKQHGGGSYEYDQHTDHQDYDGRHGGGRGFASMDREQVREIARKGGQHSHGSQGKSNRVASSTSSNTRKRSNQDGSTSGRGKSSSAVRGKSRSPHSKSSR